MTKLSRRQFAAGLAAAAAAARFTPIAQAAPFGWPIGCQTWPVRNVIGADLEGTLHNLASMGYQAIELCSPPGYKDLGFGPLAAMTGAQLRDKIHAAKLICESCHFGFPELKDHLDERIAWAKDLGLKQMIISTFGISKSATMKDWMAAVDEANKIGERTKVAGIQLGFHNHDFEFHKIDGELIYDKLMSSFAPPLVKSQFQVSVVGLGYHAADYFQKYPGQFISMHLQDWSPTEKKEVALGQGEVDWGKLFAAAKTAGVKNYFVELEGNGLRASVPFLQKLS